MINQINDYLLKNTPDEEIPKDFKQFLQHIELNGFDYDYHMAMQEKYPDFFIDGQALKNALDFAISIMAKEIFGKVLDQMDEIKKGELPINMQVNFKGHISPLEPAPDFTGCDGQPVSNDILKIWIEQAIDKEDYERAAEIRDELNRRKKLEA